jgi:hypothetical protein
MHLTYLVWYVLAIKVATVIHLPPNLAHLLHAKKNLDRHETRLVIKRALEPQQVGDYLFECYTLIYPKLYERRAISSKLNLN